MSLSVFDKYNNRFDGMMTNFDNFCDFNRIGFMGDFVNEYENFVEKDGNYVLDIKLSNDMAENVKITEEKEQIKISGKKKIVNESKKGCSVYRSVEETSFNKQYTLPKDAVINTMTSKYEDGILSITVQKKKDALL